MDFRQSTRTGSNVEMTNDEMTIRYYKSSSSSFHYSSFGVLKKIVNRQFCFSFVIPAFGIRHFKFPALSIKVEGHARPILRPRKASSRRRNAAPPRPEPRRSPQGLPRHRP